jgi:hypothetical protein
LGMSDQDLGIPGGNDDLTEDMITSARKRTRVNAVILLLVFALLSFAPLPWAAFAPLLLIIPLLHAALGRMHRGPSSPGRPPSDRGGSSPEPYSQEPRDPSDPRRYRPID